MRLNYPVIFPLNQIAYVGEDDSQFFCQIHGRKFNALSSTYMLPADEEEVRVRTFFPQKRGSLCDSYFRDQNFSIK